MLSWIYILCNFYVYSFICKVDIFTMVLLNKMKKYSQFSSVRYMFEIQWKGNIGQRKEERRTEGELVENDLGFLQ